jgi:hypothetical protein
LIDLRGLAMTADGVTELFAEMALVAADVLVTSTYVDGGARFSAIEPA